MRQYCEASFSKYYKTGSDIYQYSEFDPDFFFQFKLGGIPPKICAMPSDRIIDTRLLIPLDLGSSIAANTAFAQDVQGRGHLAIQLLIYDTLIIPTKDFGIVPILAKWMGMAAFQDALKAQAFSFLHLPSMLGYAGNGVGISGFVIGPSLERPFRWWQTAVFGDISTAIELQIRNGIEGLTSRQRSHLIQSVTSRAQSLSYSNDDFMQNIVHETYTDIMGSPELSALVSLLSRDPRRIDLTKVPGVEPNQMKISHVGPIREPADVVLRVAEMNLAIFMASAAQQADLVVPNGAGLVMQSKLARAGIDGSISQNLIRLLELNKLPDPSFAVAADELSLEKIWELRQSRTSRRFRSWLRDVNAHDPRELERAYVESLGEISFVGSLPNRTLRFLLTAGIGAANPIIGLAAGAADTFALDRLTRGFRPKLFIDKFRSLLIED